MASFGAFYNLYHSKIGINFTKGLCMGSKIGIVLTHNFQVCEKGMPQTILAEYAKLNLLVQHKK